MQHVMWNRGHEPEVTFQSLQGAHVRCNQRQTRQRCCFSAFQSLQGAHVRCNWKTRSQCLTGIGFNRSRERMSVATCLIRKRMVNSHGVSIAPGSACPLQLCHLREKVVSSRGFNRSRERMSVATKAFIEYLGHIPVGFNRSVVRMSVATADARSELAHMATRLNRSVERMPVATCLCDNHVIQQISRVSIAPGSACP